MDIEEDTTIISGTNISTNGNNSFASGSIGGLGTVNVKYNSTYYTTSTGLPSTISFTDDGPEKTSCLYIIVLPDGACLELREQQSISPREMIGICKFISLVTQQMLAPVKYKWLDIIDTLGIDSHFVDGLENEDEYIDESVQYFFLYEE